MKTIFNFGFRNARLLIGFCLGGAVGIYSAKQNYLTIMLVIAYMMIALIFIFLDNRKLPNTNPKA